MDEAVGSLGALPGWGAWSHWQRKAEVNTPGQDGNKTWVCRHHLDGAEVLPFSFKLRLAYLETELSLMSSHLRTRAGRREKAGVSTPWVPLGEWLRPLGLLRPRVQIGVMVIVRLPRGVGAGSR